MRTDRKSSDKYLKDMRNKYHIFLIALLFAGLFSGQNLSAQKFSVSTNLAGYLNFGTLNIEASYPVARHWCITAGAKYNPFTFNLGQDKQDARSKQQLYAAGVRYWPWHVYSGWWIAGKVQYQEYNIGGITSPSVREGDRYGAAISGGYAYMFGKHFNIEFGAGIWSGLDKYTKYACPVCGPKEDSGKKIFILPSDIIIAFSFVF